MLPTIAKMDNLKRFLLLIAYIQLFNHVITTNGADIVLENYKPVAMDESWSINGGSYKDGLKSMSLARLNGRKSDSLFMDDLDSRAFSLGEMSPKIDMIGKRPSSFSSRLDSKDAFRSTSAPFVGGRILDVESHFDADTENNLFREPRTETTELTQLLRRKPTFIRNRAVKPEIFSPNGTSKVLATYKFIVPIYIPAVKKLAIKTGARREEPKFVKETVTEMVPVTQNVPRMKELIKAVKVPQKVITDFVEARGNTIPQTVDDKVRPGEKVLSTVVKDYD